MISTLLNPAFTREWTAHQLHWPTHKMCWPLSRLPAITNIWPSRNDTKGEKWGFHNFLFTAALVEVDITMSVHFLNPVTVSTITCKDQSIICSEQQSLSNSVRLAVKQQCCLTTCSYGIKSVCSKHIFIEHYRKPVQWVMFISSFLRIISLPSLASCQEQTVSEKYNLRQWSN